MVNKKKYIYIPIEIKVRELWPKLWLASQIVKKDFICIVGDKNGVHTAMQVYPPGIYFDKSISQNKTAHLRKIGKMAQAIVCQDEEAGIARDEIESFFAIRVSEENIGLTKRFYCWGQTDYEYLCNKYSAYANRFRLTGSPRIDLWRTEIAADIYKNEMKRIKSKYADYILINSSFGITNEAEIEKRLKQALAYGNITRQNYSSKKKELEIRLNEFRTFVEMINEIALSRPHQNFVVRPHPSEPLDEWKKQLKTMKNLHLIRDGDVTPWIAASKAIIHEGCTTGLQGVLMKKPVLSFVPKSQVDGHVKYNDFPNKVSFRTLSVKELLQMIDRLDKGWGKESADYRLKFELLTAKIAKVNGKYAAELIAEDLSTLEVPAYSQPTQAKIFFGMQYRRTQKLASKIMHQPHKQKDSFAPRTSKEKIPGGVRKKEIESFLSSLKSVDSDVGRLKIKKLAKNVYAISQ